MWGFYNKRNRKLANVIFNKILDPSNTKYYNNDLKSPKQGDQNFLNDHIYGLVLNDTMSHDSYFCKGYEKGKPFPNKRVLI
jgi:hypothetical protein